MADTTKTDTKPADEKAAVEASGGDVPDTRDTNKAQGAVAEAQAKAAEAAKDQKVVRRFADGSSEWSTVGELADTHADPHSFPGTGDLNPAYSPGASTHNGAAE